jgi:DNA-binding transcriptional ArsR family regulator
MSLDDAEDQSGLRRLSDPRELRALAHPVRVALFEQLSLGGALTATQLGELIGESPTTCSFHLRQLAKYGFVAEAGGGKGRARPWRLSSLGLSFSSRSADDPETVLAADALSRIFTDRSIDRHRKWLATKHAYPAEWQDADEQSEYVFYLTPAELRQLKDELTDVLLPTFQKYHERVTDPALRPPSSAPVELLLLVNPVALPAPASAEQD